MPPATSDREFDATVDEETSKGSALAGRRRVTAALLVAMMVTAMEQLVVSPAMPTIIAQLHGFEIYPWVISAYLLASTVSTPIYGKLADLYGRKPILLFGLVLFSLGSILSGTSQSMGQLIAMRTLQGLGAGAVGPIVLTMLGDLFTLHERARVQGLFSAVWGLSSVAGPIVGGYLTDNVGWRWVFLVSEPHVDRKVAPIDWAGAGLLSAGLTSLLLLVLDGSQHGTVVASGLGAASVAFLVLFVLRELRAADPILPMDLMTRPVIAASLAGSCLIGAILFGIDTYIPLYIQGVQGGDARLAGRSLMPLFLTWAFSVAVAARAVVHRGLRFGGLAGSFFITLGSLGLVAGAVFPQWYRYGVYPGLVLVGLGMGPTSLSFILSVQHSVKWGQRGVATGAVIFLRTIGGALGVGLLGAALGWELTHRLAAAGASGINITAALRPETHQFLSADQLALVQSQLGHALRDVYIQMAVLGIGTMLCALGLPNKQETHASAAESGRDEDDDEGFAVAAAEL
jgi:multidrug resistance protein